MSGEDDRSAVQVSPQSSKLLERLIDNQYYPSFLTKEVCVVAY